MEEATASLPTPTVWDIDGNGFHASLQLTRVDDASGKVIGNVSDNTGQFVGSWEGDARRFTFKRTLSNGEVQTFTGFLFDSSGDPNNAYAMAGTFVGDRFEDPRRPGFGWFALGDPAIV